MFRRALFIAMIVASLVLIGLLTTTTPATAGPVGVLAIFILVYIIVLGVVTFGLYGVSHMLMKMSSTLTVKRPFRVLSFRKSYYFGSVVALGPVMLVGMQSVSGIGIYELLLVCFFVVVGCIYVSRRMA